jgi:hypothetical protein
MRTLNVDNPGIGPVVLIPHGHIDTSGSSLKISAELYVLAVEKVVHGTTMYAIEVGLEDAGRSRVRWHELDTFFTTENIGEVNVALNQAIDKERRETAIAQLLQDSEAEITIDTLGKKESIVNICLIKTSEDHAEEYSGSTEIPWKDVKSLFIDMT